MTITDDDGHTATQEISITVDPEGSICILIDQCRVCCMRFVFNC